MGLERWDPAGFNSGNTVASTVTGAITGAATGAGLGALGLNPFTVTAGTIGGAVIGGLSGAMSGYSNDTWSLKRNDDGTVTFSPEEGAFVRYNNKEGAVKDRVSHMFWDKTNGDVYYEDPNRAGTYIKLQNTSGLDTNNLLNFASDDQLDAYARAIAEEIGLNSIKQLQNEKNQRISKHETTPLQEIVVPNRISLEEYDQKKADASKLLELLIAQSTADTPVVDDKVYYKYGSNEIDLEYYIHNLGTNLQKYIESKNWNQAQIDSFIKAFNDYKSGLINQLNNNTERFTTDDAGIVQDNMALLSGQNGRFYIDSEGNVYNSTDEISNKKLRKSAKLFSPNDEVANYLNTIGQAIVSAGKVKQLDEGNGAFDINKNGFESYWLSKINPAGGDEVDMTPFLALDPVNPEGKRERTNRMKYLAHELNNYYNYISNSNLKFSKTNFKTKEKFLEKITEAINNLNNGWDDTDVNSLQAIGIPYGFYSKFLSEESDPLLSPDQLQEKKNKQKAEALHKYISDLKTVYDKFAQASNTYTHKNPLSYTKNNLYNPDTDGENLNFKGYLDSLDYPTQPQNIGASIEALWDSTKSALREGRQTVLTLKGERPIQEVLSVLMPSIEKQFKTSKTGIKYYDDPEFDSQFGAILCIVDGKLEYKFIGDVKDGGAWESLKTNFEQTYSYDSDKKMYSFDKMGGILKKLKEGGYADYEDLDGISEEEIQQMMQLMQLPLQTKSISQMLEEGKSLGEAITEATYGQRMRDAESHHMNFDQYNLKQRKLNGTPDPLNPDSGIWKKEDYLRLGAILTDIVSFALPTGWDAGANVVSTGLNLLADWADNSVSTSDMIKNLGMNLGMDLLGVIPIVGDASGIGGKLLKNTKKIAPKLLYALSAYGILETLENSNDIINSIKKITSDEKLTVGDWQNIAQAITAAAGINSGVKAGVSKKLAKKEAHVDDAIGVGLRKRDANGNLGKSQDFILRGEHAKEIRELIQKGEVDKVNEKIKSLHGFENYEINTGVTLMPVGMHLPFKRTTGADGNRHWERLNVLGLNKGMDFFEIYDTNLIKGGRYLRTGLNTKRQNAVRSNDYASERLKNAEEINQLKIDEENRIMRDLDASTAEINGKITEQENKLNGLRDENGNLVAGQEGLIHLRNAKQQEFDQFKADHQTEFDEYKRIKDHNHDKSVRVTIRKTGKQEKLSIDGNEPGSISVDKEIKDLEKLLNILSNRRTVANRAFNAANSAHVTAENKYSKNKTQNNKSKLDEAEKKLKEKQDAKDKADREFQEVDNMIKELLSWKKDFITFLQKFNPSTNSNSIISLHDQYEASLADFDTRIQSVQNELSNLRQDSTLKQFMLGLHSGSNELILPGGFRVSNNDLLNRIRASRKFGGTIQKMSSGSNITLQNTPQLIQLSSVNQNNTQYDTSGRAGGRYSSNSGSTDDKKSSKSIISSIADKLPSELLNFIQYGVNADNNRRITQFELDNTFPYHTNTKSDYVLVIGHYPSIEFGSKALGKALRVANVPVTSDAALQASIMAEQFSKGMDQKRELELNDDQKRREKQKEAETQSKENHEYDYVTKKSNDLADIKALEDKKKIKSSALSQQAKDLLALIQKLDYNSQKREAEIKAVQSTYAASQIKAAVMNNPNEYGANLTDEELAVYNKKLSGVSISSLTDQELTLLGRASTKIEAAIVAEYSRYQGAHNTEYFANATYHPQQSPLTFVAGLSDIQSAKNGTKLKIEKIRELVKNADRFQKSLDKQQDRFQKQLDRISKSMNGLPKITRSSKLK